MIELFLIESIAGIVEATGGLYVREQPAVVVGLAMLIVAAYYAGKGVW